MTLTTISPGIDTGFSTKLNNNFRESLTQSGLNTIRSLIDRAGVWSKGNIDGWGEAYIDVDGRGNSVTAATTKAYFVTNKYTNTLNDQASGDTTNDPSTFTNPTYAFDNNTATYAAKANTGIEAFNNYLGKTFGAKTINYIYINAYFLITRGSGKTYSIELQTYDGGTWTSIATLTSGTAPDDGSYPLSYLGVYTLGSSVQGARVRFNGDAGRTGSSDTCDSYLYSLEYGDYNTSAVAVVTHTIPTGTFSPTISKSIGVPMISDWETGADINYKLTNAGEDSGWLNTNSITSFTALTSEPTTLIVRLVPKSSSPAAGYPSIKGFWVRAV